MEVELFTEETSEDENYVHDDNIEDYLDFDGERCGICMEVIIDRGVLDCCQHWFCFACIDNWATITSLCPLCQNEFQLITCVPVYDTVGGNKTDEDEDPREDEWFVEGKNNSLSFPSYYIDENAVVCLDGDGCKIRSGSVAVEEDLDIDTSIACDSCDKWYHAFCVGFNPDGTCDSSWLCPRCTVDNVPQKSERLSVLRQSYQQGLEIGTGSQLGDSFSRRVSVSVAGVGETAVIVSLVEGNKRSHESGDLASGFPNDMKNTLCNSTSIMPESEAPLDTRTLIEPNSAEQKVGLSSQADSLSSSHSLSTGQLNVNAEDAEQKINRHLNKKSVNPGVDLDLGLSVRSCISGGVKDNERAKDHKAEFMEPNISSVECSLSGVVIDDKMVQRNMDVVPSNNMISDEKETVIRITSAKRKRRDSRDADDGEIEAKISQKKIKAERSRQLNSQKEQTPESTLDDSRPISRRNVSKESKLKCDENGAADITAIIQGSDRKSRKQLGQKNSSGEEKETAGGLRLKKIMRRTDNDKDSSVLVQELRKKIKEAVRNKSSKDLGQSNFDPKLLDAFRAALSGPGTENRKPTLDVKAKKAMLQKGKVRESLTKKIYGAGGKRKRAWTRECEVEFWKHRCQKASRPEKVETLKSVLDLLRDETDNTKKMPDSEVEQSGSILSRLYLADASVCPRKNNVKPVSSLNAMATTEQTSETILTEKISSSSLTENSDRIPPKNSNLSRMIVPPLDSKGMKKSLNGMKASSEKEVVSKSDITKGDRRQWALELLARKTAASSKSGQEKEDNSATLKGNYPLLAQLPKDMRPILAPSRHNRIPASVRQAQLHRLTEHFLKKANLSVVCKTAETELAVADAVNIEKEVADRSSSKLVYVNLCSQELLRRSDNTNSECAKESKESNPCSTSEDVFDRPSEEANNGSSDLAVDEALRNAGLMSPPDSPNHAIEDNFIEAGSPEKIENEEPDNIFEVDPNADLDIYGDFEYNLEDDDFIGAAALRISEPQPEEPKIKLVFSSVNPEKPEDVEAVNGSSCLLESDDKTGEGCLSVDTGKDEGLIQNSVDNGDEEPSLAECEELYGPDKEPIFVKYPETASIATGEPTINPESTGEKRDPKELPSDLQKPENLEKKKEKTSKNDSKKSANSNTVVKKVEAYIKEHIRPLCKSGVITVEQYRWAVGKTTEKVMKYHSKEKNANFLIKEGEKVKKLAEQYVEAAPLKAKN